MFISQNIKLCCDWVRALDLWLENESPNHFLFCFVFRKLLRTALQGMRRSHCHCPRSRGRLSGSAKGRYNKDSLQEEKADSKTVGKCQSLIKVTKRIYIFWAVNSPQSHSQSWGWLVEPAQPSASVGAKFNRWIGLPPHCRYKNTATQEWFIQKDLH